MLVSRHVYLTDTKTDSINWNKGNNVCICFLAFPSLNCWRTHTEHTRVLCSSTLVWCGLQVTCSDHENNVHVLHTKFSSSCVHTSFFKNTRVELQNTRMLLTRMFKVRTNLYRMHTQTHGYLSSYVPCNYCT